MSPTPVPTRNLVVEGTDIVTDDLGSGASEHVDLAGVAAGRYTMFCAIPAHREAGMQATLTVAGTPAAAGDGAAAAPPPSPARASTTRP